MYLCFNFDWEKALLYKFVVNFAGLRMFFTFVEGGPREGWDSWYGELLDGQQRNLVTGGREEGEVVRNRGQGTACTVN